MIGQPFRLAAVAVAAQVGRHHGEILREALADDVPGHMSQRVAVEQQQRRTFAAHAPNDPALGIAGLDLELPEALEHRASFFLN
ncbi:hypothetical protein D3C83_84390 [compost metagenome]